MAPRLSAGGQLAGWFPDPAGRHQYRYWNGTAWTDNVADNGVPGTDPLDAPPAAVASSTVAGAPPGAWRTGASPGGPAPRAGSSPKPALLVFLGVVAVVAIVAVVIFVARNESGDTQGTGTFDGEVSDEDDLFVRRFSVPEGSVIVLRADPDASFDVTLGILTTDDDLAGRYREFFARSAFDPDASAGTSMGGFLPGTALNYVDPGGSGREEVLVLPAPFGGEFTAVTGGYDGSTGDVELEVTVEPFEADTDDAEEYLEDFFGVDFTD